MFLRTVLLAAVLCSVASALFVPQRVTLENTLPCVAEQSCQSHDWTPTSDPVDADRLIFVVFAVKQLNLDVVADTCDSVSDPTSTNYGSYLNLNELGEITRNEDGTAKVHAFLRRNGVQYFTTTTNGEYIRAQMRVSKAEELLHVKFQEFMSFRVSHTIVRTLDAYSLPANIAEAVDYVLNVNQFPVATNKPNFIQGVRTNPDGYTGDVTPALLESFYNIPSTAVQNSNITQSLFEALGQSFSPTDLSTYQQKFSVNSVSIDNIIGPNQPSACSQNYQNCFEANLDVQQITAIANGAETTYWAIDSSAQDPFTVWIAAVAGDATPPAVHSMSYGAVESDIPDSQLTQFNTEAMKLCTRGVSIVVSSGDDGAMNYEACQYNQCTINPSWPATCPYVTAVGATQGPESNSAEIACQSNQGGLITSGGGFSTFYPQPSYQSSAVSSYLSSGVTFPPSSDYNSGNRAYPDVAMMGHNYPIVDGGNVLVGSGTSASAPVFAGILSLVNDALKSAGQPTVGFVNPALYQATSVFNDITSGENNCCAGQTNPTCCPNGYSCTTGFDAVTGLGSVDAQSLISTITSNMMNRAQ